MCLSIPAKLSFFGAALKSITHRPTDEVLEADEVLELQEGVEEGEDRLDLEGGRPQEVYSVFRHAVWFIRDTL